MWIEQIRMEPNGKESNGREKLLKSVCCHLNCASLRLMVVASMAHMIEKWVEEGKRTKKLRKILVIAKGKMSLSRLVVSLNTSIRERIKCEGKSIMRCYNKESKNRVRGFVIEL